MTTTYGTGRRRKRSFIHSYSGASPSSVKSPSCTTKAMSPRRESASTARSASSNAVCVSPTTANRSRSGAGSATSRAMFFRFTSRCRSSEGSDVGAVLEAGGDEHRRGADDGPHA